ncbi:hypothetical protein QUA00_25955 [Microcoleus sp. T2B6]|uniref:Ig-like domain-containing protein n=1 Tax=Microcoleus sp. T2B6 TaxID=3055424 RepID=UPI002FD49C98
MGGSDPDGSIVSYTIDTLPPAGQAVLFLGDPANGGVPVTPGQVLTPAQLQQLFLQATGNFTGTNFTYRATDNSGASSPAVATVAAILPTDNQPPVANNSNSRLGPNSSRLVTGLGGSDPDGSIASYTIDTLPPADQAVLFLGDPALGGGVPVTPGQVLTPAQLQQLFLQATGNFTGTNFTYRAKDNSGAISPVATASVAGLIGPTQTPTPTDNQPPLANNANSRVGPNSSRLVTGLGGSDPDGSIVSYTINTLPPADQAVLFLGDPANGGVPVTPGQVLTPEQLQQLFLQATGNFTGANFTYSATDNSGASSPATATVAAILPTGNQPPLANNSNSRLGPNSSQLVTGLGGSDADGSIVSYTIDTLPPADQAVLFLGDPANGGVPVTPGQVLTPPQLQQLFFFTTGNFTGTNFTYRATDNSGAISPVATASVAGLIRPTPTPTDNQPPLANNANSRLGPNSSRLVTGLGGRDPDPDGSIVFYTINTLPSPDQAVLFLGDPALGGGVPVTQGQVLTPQQLQQLFFFTTGNFTGANFTYSATDNTGAISPVATATVAGLIGPTPTPTPAPTPTTPTTPTPTDNLPPVANNANSSLGPNSSRLVTGLGGSDPDGSIVSYTINTLPPVDQAVLYLGDPANGGVPVTPGQVLTPAQLQQLFFFTTGNFTGTNFTYTATDNSGAISPVATASVAGLIGPTPTPSTTDNQPPVANNANSRVGPNSSQLVTGLGGSDPDGSIVSYTINTLPSPDQAVLFLGDPANGGVPVTPGQVLTPAQLQQLFLQATGNFTGANFTYSATDNSGATSPATATVAAILPTDNQPPVANNANSSLAPNSSQLVTGLGGSDPDGSIVSYTINTLPPADQAVLYLGDPANGGVPVTAGQVLTPAQLQQLFFFTTGNFTGTNFTYSATDNSGATSPAVATVVAILRSGASTPTPTPASPIVSNPIGEPDTDCQCSPIIEKPGINFAPPQQPPAVGFVRPISQFSEGQTTKGTDEGDGFIVDTKGNQKIVGFGGNDLLLGEDGADEIYGNEDNDRVFGGIDTDIVDGGEGNDSVYGGKQNDWVAGDLDSDTLFGDLGADTILGDNGQNNSQSPDEARDLLFGGNGADLINGNEGDDIIHTGKGGDIALGGKENDLIWGELANDTLFGGIGSDSLFGGIPDQRATDSEGRDLLYGGFGNDFLNGQQDNDTLVAGKDNDPAYGGKGNDLLYGQLGSDTLYGGEGADTLLGDSGSSQSIGDLGEQDLIFSDSGNDIIGGGHGNDTVQAGKGNDCVWGGKDNDLIWGELGSDTLVGDSGDDTMYGGARSRAKDIGGQDLLFGGIGADVLFGDEGDDTISGGEDNDLIYGGKANDLIHGDQGDDLIYGGYGSDELCGGEGNDTIYGDRADNRAVSVGANDQQDCINGGDGDDLLYGNEGQDTINADAGSDTLIGGKDNDLLNGGAGDDWLFGDLGEDTLIGGIGFDRYVLSADGGTDTVINFEVAVDKFVLSGGLSFQQLQFSATPNGTLLQVAGTDRVLANLVGVNGAIGSSDFLPNLSEL